LPKSSSLCVGCNNVTDHRRQTDRRTDRQTDRRTDGQLIMLMPSSSFRMPVMNHNWSATKQRPHPQSEAEISHHSVLSGDRIRQCGTSSGSRRKDTSCKSPFPSAGTVPSSQGTTVWSAQRIMEVTYSNVHLKSGSQETTTPKTAHARRLYIVTRGR